MQDHLEPMANRHTTDPSGVPVHGKVASAATNRQGGGSPLSLDLNQHLIKQPRNSFLFQIAGHSWASEGVFDGDIAIIDRELPASASDLVVLWQASGFSLARHQHLVSGDEPLGVVTSVIHQYRHSV